MIWMRITLITVLIISSGSATYASGQPSYIISSSKVPQLNPIKYEIAFVSRFDNRIVVDVYFSLIIPSAMVRTRL